MPFTNKLTTYALIIMCFLLIVTKLTKGWSGNMSNYCGNCGNSISTPDGNWLEVQYTRFGAYNYIVPDFVRRNPDNTTYHRLIQSLLAHKEPRVNICTACSILYQDLIGFAQIALDSSIAYHLLMINAIKHSAISHNYQTSIDLLANMNTA